MLSGVVATESDQCIGVLGGVAQARGLLKAELSLSLSLSIMM
jgi:hypothetical protein